MSTRLIGARIPRNEDERLLRDGGGFVDDVNPRGVLRAAGLRSAHASARIPPSMGHGMRRAGLARFAERDGRMVAYPLRIPHDFRRTAVRNLERAGVPRSTAMAMVGHRTESIYRRYAIFDETMLQEGAERLTALYRGQSPAATVVALRKSRQPRTTRPVSRRATEAAL
jgi:hypothetical protein